VYGIDSLPLKIAIRITRITFSEKTGKLCIRAGRSYIDGITGEIDYGSACALLKDRMNANAE
jgi:hypothetical protein